MSELLALLVPALATALLHFLWQGAVVGLLAWLALGLLRNARPQARYAVACIALLVCAVLPLIDLVIGLRGSGNVLSSFAATPASTASTIASAPATFNTGMLAARSANTFAWIVAFWAAGASLLSLRMLLGVLWVRRLCGDSMSDAGQQWQACVTRLTDKFGIRRPISLRIVDSGDSPVSAGWWHPVILLPAAIMARLPADLLEALIAHELAHIRRHDYLVNLVQSAVEAMLFYHPVVWWLSHRIRLEREMVADDLAADVLGERRRLAIALSELDRVACTWSPSPHPQLAQAAHGGQLMSRIQQLLRPQRRSIGATLVLPVLGLLAASVAFYAHARYQPQAVPRAVPVASAALAQASPAATPAPPAPLAPSSPPLPVPLPASGPVTAPAAPVHEHLALRGASRDASYALVRKGREGFAMSGSTDDVGEIRRARGSIDGDFLWLRRDGKAYVIRDAAVLARVEKAWLATDALSARMDVLSTRMQPHQKEMEALQARMERRQEALKEPAAMRESERQMDALGRQMESLGKRQELLARQMSSGSDDTRDDLARKMDALQLEQDRLARQMDAHAQVMESASRDIERMHAPIEAIGREMEAAARPMEAIGEDMQVIGTQIEREAKVSDQAIRATIEDAVLRGLATPAPTRQ